MPDIIVGFDIKSSKFRIKLENKSLRIGKSIIPFLRKTKLKNKLNQSNRDNKFHFLINPIVFEDKSCTGQILTIYYNDQKKITRFYLQDDYEYSKELTLQ